MLPRVLPVRSGAATAVAGCLLLVLSGCGGDPPARKAASVAATRAAAPSVAPDTLSPAVDALGKRVDALTADTSVRKASEALTAAQAKLRPSVAEGQAALKATIAYHKAEPKDCGGTASKAADVEDQADETAALATATTKAGGSLKSAADALGAKLKQVQAELDAAGKLAAESTASAANSRLTAYINSVQGLDALRSSSLQSVTLAATEASGAKESSAKQVETAEKVAAVCYRQAAALEAAREQRRAELAAEREAAKEAARAARRG